VSLTLAGILGIIVLLLVLFFLNIPVGFAMAVVGFVGFCCIVSFKAGLGMLSTDLWGSFSSYGLTVIPLFIFMGQLAFHSGLNEKLYLAAYKWVGHIRGGLAMATVSACAAFSAVCGSNAATAATMSSVALPQMKKYRYNSKLSTGSIACGSTLGVVIPPSVVLIVIGLSTEQSIAKLFYGGIGAGLVLTFFLILTIYVLCTLKPTWGPVGEKTTFKEKFQTLPGAMEMFILFILVMLGLFFGVFTPAEAGAAGSFFAIIIGIIQKGLTLKGLAAAIEETLKISCMVIMIVAGATIFGRFLTITRIPYDIAAWVTALDLPPVIIMAIIFLAYAVGGMIMDALALLLITTPIFFPVAAALGYDPIWFAVCVTVVTTLGAVTPPVGATTYVVAGMAKDVPLQNVFKGVMCFLPAYILCLLALFLFPKIITFLPTLIN
jgi:tripartite ATP-independent transporter DctM subunit